MGGDDQYNISLFFLNVVLGELLQARQNKRQLAGCQLVNYSTFVMLVKLITFQVCYN